MLFCLLAHSTFDSKFVSKLDSETLCCSSETSKLTLCYFECGVVSNNDIRRKQVDTACVNQPNKPKDLAHVLGGAESKKNRQQQQLRRHAEVRCTRIGKSRVKEIQKSPKNSYHRKRTLHT